MFVILNRLYNNHNKGENVFYIENNPYLVNNMEPFFYTKFLPEIKELDKDFFSKKSSFKKIYKKKEYMDKKFN